MDVTTSGQCPRCGASLDQGSVDGLCAKCLGSLNFATDTALPGETAATVPPPTPEEISAHFPQLEVIEFLGRGGMGVVYKARQRALGRLVALKLLAPERVADPKFAERFTHEAKALAALNHPNIVTIYDFGQAGGFYYLLMEFVDGVNLRQAMAAGRFTPEQALAVVPPVCEALQYAHEHGIVHRDIKPENLLLDKEGRVKIADFGIAKMLDVESSGVGLSETQPAGTPQYMAPEQNEHRVTDHRADIYSLGVVLYEMLTGELPSEKLQPPSKRVQVDVRIDEIVLRALEWKPELRFQTAADFRTRVENVTSGKAIAPRFSRAAIVGACWVPVSFLSFALIALASHAGRSSPTVGPEWRQLAVLIPALILGVAGPFGTTILGWVAVSRIRRSVGRIHGLQLALFDGLLYPLMTLGAVIAMATVALAKMFVDFYANPSVIGRAQSPLVTRMANWLSLNNEIGVFVGVAAAIVVNVLIFRAVRRAVCSGAVLAPQESGATGNQIQVASIAVIFALIGTVLGALAAMRGAGAWPAMALSLLFAGLAIFMALPARRLGVGKCALIVATFGIVIWPLMALFVRQGRTAADVNAFGIEKVEITVDRAVVRQRHFHGEGMIVTFGPMTDRWTPAGVYLEAMFDITLEPTWFGRGASWVVKSRRGIHASYRLDRPPGSNVGRIVFHPGTPVPETDGSYVIGEFRSDDGEALPIAVRLQYDKQQNSSPAGAQVPSTGSMPAGPLPPMHIDFKMTRVEQPPGSRVIALHFERDKNYGLGLEVSQDVMPSPDGKTPKPGYRNWQQKTFIGWDGDRVLSWQLPEEFSPAQAQGVAKEVEQNARKMTQLPDGAVVEFGKARHSDGWTYLLLARVRREWGSPHPPAPPGANLSVEKSVIVPGDRIVRLKLHVAGNHGPIQDIGQPLYFKIAHDRTSGFLLRWHAYNGGAAAGRGGKPSRVVLDLVDGDTGIIRHRLEHGFGMAVRYRLLEGVSLPAKNSNLVLGEPGLYSVVHLLLAEKIVSSDTAIADQWKLMVEIGCVGPDDANAVPLFQWPAAPGAHTPKSGPE